MFKITSEEKEEFVMVVCDPGGLIYNATVN